MRSRIIRPEFWNDEKLASVSRDARLTFAGLWMTSDDYGVSKGHLSWIKSQIFPYDADIKLTDFGKWIDELKAIRAVVPFETNGEKYLFIRTFSDHQKVDHPSGVRNPEPPGNILDTLASDSRATRAKNPLLTETETEAETETETIRGSKADKLKKQIHADKEKFSSAWKENLEFYKTKYPALDLKFQFDNVMDWVKREPAKAHKSAKGDLNLFFQRWLNKEKPNFAPKIDKHKQWCEVGAERHEPGPEKTPDELRADEIADLQLSIKNGETFLEKCKSQKQDEKLKASIKIVVANIERLKRELAEARV